MSSSTAPDPSSSAATGSPRVVRKVALLTAGGLAPCLSAAVGDLIERYTEVAPDVEIIAYLSGYQGLLTGDVPRGHRRGSRACRRAAPVRRLADREQPREADQRGRPREARDRRARRRPAPGGGGAARRRRRRRPPHDRWRRHQHDGRRSRRLPARARLRPDGGRDAEDRRQRRHPDPAVSRCVDGRRAGCPVRHEHRRRAELESADARDPRGDGAPLRVADGGHGGGVQALVGRPGVEPRHRARQRASGRSTPSTFPRCRSTSRPKRSGCGP